MIFSKGKRIDDETSKRILDLAMNIGCKEGAEALTVTRLCKELNCDRRVIYNRFRDIDEIDQIVAQRCDLELIAHARQSVDPQASYHDGFMAFIEASFAYIYERKAAFQHYMSLYQIVKDRIRNGVLQELDQMIEAGKRTGDVRADIDSYHAAADIWLILTGISGMLAGDSSYRYQEGLDIVRYGVRAILDDMRPERAQDSMDGGVG